MQKKTLIFLFIIGLVLLSAGVFIKPELVGNYLSKKLVNSEWKEIRFQFFRYYIVVAGLSIILTSAFFYLFPKLKTFEFFLLSICFFGVLFTITALILNPIYAAKHFTNVNFLNVNIVSLILSNQQILIVIGCLLIFVPFTVYLRLVIKSKEWLVLIPIIFGIIVYSILFYHTYLKIKYPSNIISQPQQYGKVLELILGQDILLSDFDPQSTLKVERKRIYKAKFPVVDINLHLSSAFQTEADREVLSPENLIKAMDSVGVQMVFNSDVQNSDLEAVLNRYSRRYPERFKNLWPTGFPPGINSNERLADLPKHLEEAIKMGAIGEGELWKNLGLTARDESGKVLGVDDPRIDPLWAKAGELGVPVLWHMGDPAPMFQPVNRFNERYVELRRYPEWSYYGPDIPSRETIMSGRENVLRKHPNTIFIGCHMGWNSDDLSSAGYLLDNYPNYYLDLSTTLSELGRQPITTRKFFIKYQDRILFGTDGGSLFNVKGWTVEKFYQAYFEFLETDNEYIDYPMQGAINQGSWKIYGINLPDSVLQKIYYKNAEKLYKIKIAD